MSCFAFKRVSGTDCTDRGPLIKSLCDISIYKCVFINKKSLIKHIIITFKGMRFMAFIKIAYIIQQHFQFVELFKENRNTVKNIYSPLHDIYNQHNRSS